MMFFRNISSLKVINYLKYFPKVKKIIVRSVSQEHFVSGAVELEKPLDAYYYHFTHLKLPEKKVLATYVWIDGSGINMRSKDRVLLEIPCDLSKIPKWSFDGSSTGQAKTANSDVLLLPVAMYKDPFRKGPHVLILCETLHGDGTPTSTNHRAKCVCVLNTISDQVPMFGIEQEYTMFHVDLWPLGWPQSRGFPVQCKHEFSYCGIGTYVAGRDIVECHTRACMYAGMDYEGSNAEVMKSSWEFQVGAIGIKAADDLWMGRYLLHRIAEQFNTVISFHPKPMGKDQPGIGCHHNFSVKKMRCDGGITEIERVCKVLCDNHETYMENYGLNDGEENRKRLQGSFETARFDTCRWGVADRSASVRLQRSVAMAQKGYLEDRRPAGDCDPYRVCALLAETCT